MTQMNAQRRIHRAAPVVGTMLLAALAAGCLSSGAKVPPVQHYELNAWRPAALPNAGHAADAVLRVGPFRAAPEVARAGINVLPGPSRREASDRYQFIASPEALVAGQTRRWISASGLFAGVEDAGAAAHSRYVLDGLLTEIGADLRDRSAPKAILALEVMLLDSSTMARAPLWQRAYREAVPLQEVSAEAIVKGIDAALEKVLAALESDLRTALQAQATSP